jgi:hypothetical protein
VTISKLNTSISCGTEMLSITRIASYHNDLNDNLEIACNRSQGTHLHRS